MAEISPTGYPHRDAVSIWWADLLDNIIELRENPMAEPQAALEPTRSLETSLLTIEGLARQLATMVGMLNERVRGSQPPHIDPDKPDSDAVGYLACVSRIESVLQGTANALEELQSHI